MQLLEEIHNELEARRQELEKEEAELCERLNDNEKRQKQLGQVLKPLNEMFGEKTAKIEKITTANYK